MHQQRKALVTERWRYDHIGLGQRMPDLLPIQLPQKVYACVRHLLKRLSVSGIGIGVASNPEGRVSWHLCKSSQQHMQSFLPGQAANIGETKRRLRIPGADGNQRRTLHAQRQHAQARRGHALPSMPVGHKIGGCNQVRGPG